MGRKSVDSDTVDVLKAQDDEATAKAADSFADGQPLVGAGGGNPVPDVAPTVSKLSDLSAEAKRQILRAMDFAARRESISGEQLDALSLQLRTVLGL